MPGSSAAGTTLWCTSFPLQSGSQKFLQLSSRQRRAYSHAKPSSHQRLHGRDLHKRHPIGAAMALLLKRPNRRRPRPHNKDCLPRRSSSQAQLYSINCSSCHQAHTVAFQAKNFRVKTTDPHFRRSYQSTLPRAKNMLLQCLDFSTPRVLSARSSNPYPRLSASTT